MIGFSDKTTIQFHPYLKNRAFFVSLDNVFSETGTTNFGVPKGSILGLSLFLLHINDILQALSDSHTHLYGDDTCIFYQHKEVVESENVLNKKFANVFVDNSLSIHFGEHKTKCIRFSKEKNLPKLNTTYQYNRIKQFNLMKYNVSWTLI